MYTKVESWEYIESIDNDFIFHRVQDCSLNELQSLDRQVPGRIPLNHFCCIFVIIIIIFFGTHGYCQQVILQFVSRIVIAVPSLSAAVIKWCEIIASPCQ